jgi:YbgC/YbaW family acyl-CoA thioester hydrolase
MKRADFRRLTRLRVRWAEVDMQKIVFNAHYLMYFDTAVADYWRALGLPYEAAMQRLGGDLYVRKATVEYHASARADDALDVGLRCARVGTTSLTFEGGVFRGEQFLVGGELVYVFADPATQTSKPVPDTLRALLQDFEAGQSVVRVTVGDWAKLSEPAAAVRTEVFVEEQGIAREDEWDAGDATAVHAVVFNRLDQPLATGRLLQQASGVGHIGRMAVLRSMRASGQGARVLHALLDAAWARGDTEVLLNAQRSAEGFYRRLGFIVRGEPFEEVGIPHVQMALARPAGRSETVIE